MCLVRFLVFCNWHSPGLAARWSVSTSPPIYIWWFASAKQYDEVGLKVIVSASRQRLNHRFTFELKYFYYYSSADILLLPWTQNMLSDELKCFHYLALGQHTTVTLDKKVFIRWAEIFLLFIPRPTYDCHVGQRKR